MSVAIQQPANSLQEVSHQIHPVKLSRTDVFLKRILIEHALNPTRYTLNTQALCIINDMNLMSQLCSRVSMGNKTLRFGLDIPPKK